MHLCVVLCTKRREEEQEWLSEKNPITFDFRGLERKKIRCPTFLNCLQQKTYQDIADESGYYVVEQSADQHNYPRVVAAPTAGKIATEPLENEDDDLEVDFDRMFLGGRVMLRRPPKVPFWRTLPCFEKHRKGKIKSRGQRQQKILRQAGLV